MKTAAASNLEHLDICCFWAFAATPSPGTNVIRMQTNVKIRTGTNVKCKLGGIPKATNWPQCQVKHDDENDVTLYSPGYYIQR